MKIIKRRNYSIFGFNAENFMKIRQGMTSGECVENKWFNMKYIGKYLSVEILLTHEYILYVITKIYVVLLYKSLVLIKNPFINKEYNYTLIQGNLLTKNINT
jgi:hypothetical protein